jgi:hypothetical protein
MAKPVTAFDFWKPIINDFDPVSQVSPEDLRDFFVDRKENQPTQSIVARLKASFRNSIGQKNLYKILLTGHVGSGKTSELMRLGQELSDYFFVVWLDAEVSLAKEKANQFDVLLAMGVAVHLAAMAVGLKPNKKLAEKFVESFAKFIRKYEKRGKFSLNLAQVINQVFTIALSVGASAFAGPAVGIMAGAAAAGVGEAFKATTLELNVKDELVRALELPANRQEIIGRLNELIEDVQRKAKKPLLVITDGLDKLSALRARLLFADSSLLTEPAAAMAFAAPIEFYHRLSANIASSVFSEYVILPNPPVSQQPQITERWQEERIDNQSGMDVIYRIIARRIQRRELDPATVISRDAQRLIAVSSGGIIREAIRFFRDAALSAQISELLTINADIVSQVIDGQRREMRARLSTQHREALIAVLKQGTLIGGTSEAIEDDLLHALYLLSYQGDGGSFWFDAHPNALFVISR